MACILALCAEWAKSVSVNVDLLLHDGLLVRVSVSNPCGTPRSNPSSCNKVDKSSMAEHWHCNH